MLIIQVYVNYSSFADLPFVGWEMLDAPYIEGLSMSWYISPSPTGEVRWGLMTFSRSNQFLPFFTLSMIFAKKLQPPLVLPRRGDAGYLAQLFPLWADTI